MDPDENSVNEAKKLLQKIQNNKKIKVKTTTENKSCFCNQILAPLFIIFDL